MTLLDIAKAVGVSKMTMNNWMWAKTEPREENIKALAALMGVSVEEIRADVEASHGWKAPGMTLIMFLEMVEEHAEAEDWPDKQKILPYLRIIASPEWQDKETTWTKAARDLLNQRMSLHEMATILAYFVAGQKLIGEDLPPLS